MKTVAAWTVVCLAAVGGSYLSTWLVVPLIRVLAAHTDPVAATLLTVLRLAIWAAIVILGVVLGNRILK